MVAAALLVACLPFPTSPAHSDVEWWKLAFEQEGWAAAVLAVE